MKKLITVGFLCAFLFGFTAVAVQAEHAWAPYHWARSANPFTLKIGDNLSSSWDPYLTTTVSDWSASSVLDLAVVLGTKNPKTCRPTMGRGEVCNARYGQTGWLGVAQIWASGEHITQGVVKLNDTYYNLPQYNTSAWKNIVMCQEVGHILGLGHVDENMTNANLNTCMDYTNDPTSNQHPNAHDYEMLETIYAHLDTSTTVQQSATAKAAVEISDRREWGREINRSDDGRASLFERDFGDGLKVFTHVFWVNGHNHDDESARQRIINR